MIVKQIVYVDMDNVWVDSPLAFPRVPAEVKEHFSGRLDDVPGIFALMDPVPDAIASYLRLSSRFVTYILSTAPWANP